jgi:hypothetical protein
VQVINEANGEVLYTTRSHNGRIQPKVYSDGQHTVKFGKNVPNAKVLKGVLPQSKEKAGSQTIEM